MGILGAACRSPGEKIGDRELNCFAQTISSSIARGPASHNVCAGVRNAAIPQIYTTSVGSTHQAIMLRLKGPNEVVTLGGFLVGEDVLTHEE